MANILTFSISIIFIVFSYRLKLNYMLFLFLIPFLPAYIGFGVGGEGFSFSAKRIVLIILLCTFIAYILRKSSSSLSRVGIACSQNKDIIFFMLTFFSIKLISLSINKAEIALYLMIFNDFLFSIFIYFFTIIVVTSDNDVLKIIKIFFYSYSIVLVIGIVESILKIPLLSVFSSTQIITSRSVFDGYFRDGSYRLVAGFTNPVVLGEYIAVLIPIVLYYLRSIKKNYIITMIYMLLIAYVIIHNGSRSTILFIGLSIYISLYYKIKKKNSRQKRTVYTLFNWAFILAAIFYITISIIEIKDSFSGDFVTYEAKERSTIARALQYPIVFSKLKESVLFGFGRDRNYVESFNEISTLDSHYLLLLLETGIIGGIFYVLFYYSVIKSTFRIYTRINNKYILPFFISIILIMFYQITVAIPDINIYFYIILGILSSIKVNNYLFYKKY